MQTLNKFILFIFFSLISCEEHEDSVTLVPTQPFLPELKEEKAFISNFDNQLDSIPFEQFHGIQAKRYWINGGKFISQALYQAVPLDPNPSQEDTIPQMEILLNNPCKTFWLMGQDRSILYSIAFDKTTQMNPFRFSPNNLKFVLNPTLISITTIVNKYTGLRSGKKSIQQYSNIYSEENSARISWNIEIFETIDRDSLWVTEIVNYSNGTSHSYYTLYTAPDRFFQLTRN